MLVCMSGRALEEMKLLFKVLILCCPWTFPLYATRVAKLEKL